MVTSPTPSWRVCGKVTTQMVSVQYSTRERGCDAVQGKKVVARARHYPTHASFKYETQRNALKNEFEKTMYETPGML